MSNDKLSAAELSEAESDTSSIMGDSSSMDSSMKPPSPASREQLSKRIDSLLQVFFCSLYVPFKKILYLLHLLKDYLKIVVGKSSFKSRTGHIQN